MIEKHILHDINNILSEIRHSISLAEKKLENFNPKQFLARLSDDIDYLSSILNKGTKEIPKVINLKQEIEFLAAYFNTKSFNFSIDIPEDFTILIEKTDFRRIFVNLIHNSIDAIQENGRIAIYAKENLNLDKIDIYIQDNGKGIENSIKDRIFEDGFSTKGTKDERGFGLFNVKQIVEENGGEIQLVNNFPTTFKISFPFFHNTKFKKDNFSILIAEDNQSLAILLGDLLEYDGYKVKFAENGKIALDLVKNEYFDLIILDVDLPILSGISVLNEIRKENIDILVILCSGFSDLQLSDGFMPDLIIKKPYDFNYLNHKILELFNNKFN